MKVLAIAVLATAAIAQNEEIEERKFGHLYNMVWSKVAPKTQFLTRDFKNMIRNYGCYCLPIGGGKNTAQAGQAVDDTDKACRDLSRCYKCLDIDFAHNPENEKFRWTETNNGEFDCSDARNTEAQKAHCACDAEFAMTLGANWSDDSYSRFFITCSLMKLLF